MDNSTDLFKEQEKQKNLFVHETLLEEKSFKTGYKHGLNPGAVLGDDNTEDFAKISSVPQPAFHKNGGIFRFLKKKSISQRNAPEDETVNKQEEQNVHEEKNVQNQQEVHEQKDVLEEKKNNSEKSNKKHHKAPLYKRSLIDLNDAERDGNSVKIMRESKQFLVSNAEADLKKKYDEPISDFTKNLLNKIIELGKKDASLFADYDRKQKTFDEEHDTAKDCIPFLLEYKELSDKLKENRNDATLKNEYNKRYGHLSINERAIIHKYATHVGDFKGSLATDGVKLVKVKDSNIKGPSEYENKDKNGNLISKKSVVKFEDKSDYPLFSHEPNIYDMKQGNIGNCYMISSLVSIVNQDPGIITQSMKDNGKTVTVRFYKEGNPVYIEVEKTIPYREVTTGKKDGKLIKSNEQYGAKGALWVNIMEKAYAAFCGKSYYGLTNKGSEGARLFISQLTDRYARSIDLPGNNVKNAEGKNLPKKYSIKKLLHNMRKSERAAFEERLRKEGKLPASKKERNLAWNREKAKLFFGIDSKKYDEAQLSEMFRKNTAFTKWRKYFEKLMENFTDGGLRTMTELQMVIEKLRDKDFPKLNIPGLDEKKAQQMYVKKMLTYFVNGNALFSIGNDYEYSDKEKYTFNMINAAKAKKMIITTGTDRLRFERKQKTGTEGEQAGIYGNHAYAVLGTKEKDIVIGEKKLHRKFVIVSNPWQNKSRLYNDLGVGQNQKAEVNDKKENTYDNHGIFLVELKEFHHLFSSVEYQ